MKTADFKRAAEEGEDDTEFVLVDLPRQIVEPNEADMWEKRKKNGELLKEIEAIKPRQPTGSNNSKKSDTGSEINSMALSKQSSLKHEE